MSQLLDVYLKFPGAQALGSQYFLILSPSVLNSTLVPRCSRICFVVRLIMPCRLPDWANSTFPVPVILKRFLAPDLVFNLGIWLSFCGPRAADRGQPVMLGFERADGALRRRHGSPCAGQRGGRVYGREPAKWQQTGVRRQT